MESMFPHCRYDDAVFSPAEVEDFTGVSPLLQRTWRRRGFLRDRQHGRAGFNAREIAQVMTLQYLGQTLMLDLEFASEAVEKAAPVVLWHALHRSKPSPWDIRGTPAEQTAFREAIAAADLFDVDYIDRMVGVKKGEIHPFLVITPKRSDFADSFDDAFPDGSIPGAIVLDLMALGRQLGQAVPKPLIIVSNIDIQDQDLGRSRKRAVSSS